MNFYKHHLGDYAQATAHLSFVEDAAYSRLIRKYYADERPIPADVKVAQRLVGARSKEEREAVETVLQEFFDLREDGWHNKRCDTELEKASAQAETNRRIAEEREARKRERAQHDQSTNRATERATNRQPSQTPDTRHQTPEEGRGEGGGASPARGARLPTDWTLPDAWRAWAATARPDLDPQRVADRFRDYWVAKAGKDGCKRDWQATWRNWVREERAAPGRATPPAEPSWVTERRNRIAEAAPYAVARRPSDQQTEVFDALPPAAS